MFKILIIKYWKKETWLRSKMNFYGSEKGKKHSMLSNSSVPLEAIQRYADFGGKSVSNYA